MTIEIPESVVEAVSRAQLPNGGTVGEYLTSPNHDGLDGLIRTALQAALAEMLEPVGWQERYARPLPNGDRCRWVECSESDAKRIKSEFPTAYELRHTYTLKGQ